MDKKKKITKSDIATIVWQDEEITRLRKREIELESGIVGMAKENDRLRGENAQLKVEIANIKAG